MFGPAIIQSDRSVLLEVAHPDFDDARQALARFAELEKSPEHIHTYRISPVSLWNAAAAGLEADEIAATLRGLSRYEAIEEANQKFAPVEQIKRFGILERDLSQEEGELTPTMKVKRQAVYENHRDRFEALYEEG